MKIHIEPHFRRMHENLPTWVREFEAHGTFFSAFLIVYFLGIPAAATWFDSVAGSIDQIGYNSYSTNLATIVPQNSLTKVSHTTPSNQASHSR